MPSSSHIRNFLLVFTALCIVALALVICAEFAEWRWATKFVDVGQELGRLFFTATATTFILVEGGGMLAELFKRARIKEGRALEREEWQAWRVKLERWEQRRDQANAEGKDFTEPRPTPPG